RGFAVLLLPSPRRWKKWRPWAGCSADSRVFARTQAVILHPRPMPVAAMDAAMDQARLCDADPKEIMEVDDADRAIVLGHDQRADRVLVEQRHGLARQHIRTHGLRLACHDVVDHELRQVAVKIACKIAV